MIEAFILGIYMILMSPFLLKFGVESPITIFLVLFGLSTPGIYAMLRGAPFVPTVKARLNEMIDLAKIDSNTVIYDLGSGDGRFIFASCRKGAKKAIGYELSLPIYIYSKIKSFFYKNAQIRYKDFWFDAAKLKDADVVFCFLMAKPMEKFESTIWPNLKPGCKVISNVFRMPGVEPSFHEKGIRVYIKK